MLNRRLFHGRRARLFVTGVSTACLMLAYEAAKQALHPAIALWTSHFVTIAFTTALAVALRFVLQQREERSRLALNVESRAIQDITPRKLAEQALQKAEQKYRSIFENAVLGIFQTNLEGDFLSVNPALARLAGYDSPEDFLNRVRGAAEIYVDLKRRDELRELLLAQKVVRDFEAEFKTKDGGTRTTSINVGAVADSEGGGFYLEGTVQDITERKAAEARVQFLAYHDDLTGLPNRVLFEDRLAQARRRQERVAVLWLDLDNFKTINDSLGHSVGNLLLKQVGERLHRHTRAQDTVAKVGGDEFIFALEMCIRDRRRLSISIPLVPPRGHLFVGGGGVATAEL